MNRFWAHGPMFAREALDTYPEPRPHFNTVSTFIRLLEQKGFLGHEKFGGSFRYYPLISRFQYSRRTLLDVVRRYFDNSITGVMSALIKEENLTDDQVRDLLRQVREESADNAGSEV